MAGPWEKYGGAPTPAASAPTDGPWNKYRGDAPGSTYDQSMFRRGVNMAKSPEGFWQSGMNNIRRVASPTDEQRASDDAARATADQEQQGKWDSASTGDKLRAATFNSGPAAIPNVSEGSAPLAIPAAAVPSSYMKLVNLLNGSAKARIGTGAAFGAATNPKHPVIGAAVGGGLTAAGEGVSAVLGKGGDVAMQGAVGRTKYEPGLGTQLADEGLVGTANQMEGQVAGKIADRGQEIHDLVSEIPESTGIDAQQIGSKIAQNAAKPMAVPGAAPSAADQSELQGIKSFAEDVASRGTENPMQALARRMAAGARAFRGKEDVGGRLTSQLSGDEQGLYSGALKDAYRATAPETVPSGSTVDEMKALSGVTERNPEALAQADKAYSALAKARNGLDKEEQIPKSMLGFFTGAKSIPGSSLALSLMGQGATKASQATAAMNNALIRDALMNSVKSDESSK